MFKRILYKLDAVIESFGCILLMLMLGVMIFQIFCRYVLNHAFSFPEEVARFSFLWVTYTGIMLSLKASKHLRIEVLPVLLSDNGKRYLSIGCEIFNISFFLFFVKISWDMLQEIYDIGATAVAFPMPVWIVWLALPLYGGLCALHSTVNIREILSARTEAGEE